MLGALALTALIFGYVCLLGVVAKENPNPNDLKEGRKNA